MHRLTEREREPQLDRKTLGKERGKREGERKREREREEVTETCKEKGGYMYLPRWLLL